MPEDRFAVAFSVYFCASDAIGTVKVHETAFRLRSGEDALTVCQFQTRTAKHHFCRHCRIYPFHRNRVTPASIGVGVFRLQGFDPAGIPVPATVGAGMP
jgi:hypothetical protein